MSINRYEPRSHFFVDHNNLKPTNPSNEAVDAFGPVIGNETNQYRTTSFVRASETSKVFAICDGEIMIQPQTEDTTKVNLILKPAASAPYAPVKIKYFIYRGVNKSDLINNNILVDVNESDPDQPIFLQKLWKEFIDFNMPFYEQGLLDTPPETFPALLIGYNENQDGETLIEHYFKRNNDGGNIIFYQIPTCKEGEFLGNFTGRIGLDVILDYGDYELTNQDELFKLDLNFARKAEHIFDIGDIPYSTSIKEKRYKEYIHQFMDAAAFWGSHIECGKIRTISTQTGLKSSDDIYSDILNNYQTKNKIYVYIQGERTRSYNYYDTTRKVYGFEPTGQLNDTDGWPIIIEELTLPNSPTNKHSLDVKLEFEINNNIDIDKIFELDRHISVDVISPGSSVASIYPKLERPLGVVGILNGSFNYDLSQQVSFTATFAVDNSEGSILPNGLMLNGSTGQITGSPTTSSVSDVTFIATDSVGDFMKFTRTFNILPNQINCGPITFYINNLNSCATFLFINGRLKQEFPVTDYYNELWPVNLTTSLNLPTNSENLVHWVTYDRNRILNLDDVINCGAIIQNKIVFDNGSNTNLTPSTKKRRLYIASVKRNTTHNFENDNLNVNYSSAGLEKLVNSNEKYIDEIFNDKSFSFYRGKFTDGSTINSLCLIHDTNFNRKSSYFMLGITEEEYNILVYDSPTVPTTSSQLLPQDAENTFFHLEEDINFTHENIRKFKVGLWFEDNEGNISDPLYPSIDVIVYTMDGFTFFSKEFTDYHQFSKEFANAIVEFRTIPDATINPPIPAYKGEFGFDWLRIDDAPMDLRPTYYNSILSGYERPHGTDLNTEYENKDEAYKALKRQYKTVPITKTNQQYFIPYLSLFSQIFSNSVPTIPAPPFEAHLRVYVEINENINKLEFDYDSALFSISKNELTDKLKTVDTSGNVIKKESDDKTITITCLQDFSEPQQIRVLCYPLGITDKKDARLAGIILVNKNDVLTRKEANIALISVQTDINNDGTAEEGAYQLSEIERLYNTLHQSLTYCNVVQGLILDLKSDPEFKHYTDPTTGNLVDGGFILVNINNRILEFNKNTSEQVHLYLKNKFLNVAGNTIYNNYFLIFTFNQTFQSVNVIGNVSDIGKPLVVVYNDRATNPPPYNNTDRVPVVLGHEAMHGFGLYHTHKEGTIPVKEPEKLFTYPLYSSITQATATDNVMSYNIDGLTLWQWQKKFIKIK